MKNPLSKWKLLQIICVTFFIIFFLWWNTLNALGNNNSKKNNTWTWITQSWSSLKFKNIKLESEIQNLQMNSTTTQSVVSNNWLVWEWDLNWNTNDTSGNLNNASISNITYESSAWVNQVAQFDTNNYLSIPDSVNFNHAWGFTVWAWVKFENPTSYIMYRWDSTNTNLYYLSIVNCQLKAWICNIYMMIIRNSSCKWCTYYLRMVQYSMKKGW